MLSHQKGWEGNNSLILSYCKWAQPYQSQQKSTDWYRRRMWLTVCTDWFQLENYRAESSMLLSPLLCSVQKWQRPRRYVEDSKYLTTTVINIVKPHQIIFSLVIHNALQYQHPFLLFSSRAQCCTEASYPYCILLKSGNNTRNGRIKLTADKIYSRYTSTMQTMIWATTRISRRKSAVNTSSHFPLILPLLNMVSILPWKITLSSIV